MERPGLRVDGPSTPLSLHLDLGCCVVSLKLPLWGLWDLIWRNTKKIVVAVLAESFLTSSLALRGKHVLEITTEAAASWLQCSLECAAELASRI